MMKKLATYLLMFILFIACGGGDDAGSGGGTPSGGSEYLNVSNVDIPGGNTTATLNIQASNNCEWIISWNESWIRSISPTKGRGNQNATITVTVNPSSSAERTGVITVRNTNGTINRNVIITQSPNVESMELSVSTLNFSSDAGYQDVTITSNTHWVITGAANWMSLNKTEGDNNGSVIITVTANPDKTERQAVLTFTGSGGITKQLTVKQQANTTTDFRVSPSNLTAEATASSVHCSINGDAQWTIVSNQNWATLSTTSGEGNATITVSIADNTSETEREAVITVSSNVKSETVTIRQSAGTKPVVSNIQVTDKTKDGAKVSFTYQSMFVVSEYGVCYTQSGTPTVNDAHVSITGSSTQGSPTVSLTGLTPNTTYNVRVYAKSAVGIQYSETTSFITITNVPGGNDNVTPGVN
jgi:hypothetical protein